MGSRIYNIVFMHYALELSDFTLKYILYHSFGTVIIIIYLFSNFKPTNMF